MRHNIKTKQIKLPIEVIEQLSDEARRCKRTLTQQIEAILCLYTGTEDTEIAGWKSTSSGDILDAEVIG